MIERKAYICEHCNTHRPMKKHVYLSKPDAEGHEMNCYYNPSCKTCFSCKHNDYNRRINECLIDKNKNRHEHNEYEQEFSDWEKMKFEDLPIGMQIMKNCEHWTDAYGIEVTP